MNTSPQHDTSGVTGRGQHVRVAVLAVNLLLPVSMRAGAEESFQPRVLFSPSDSQLRAESRGRVMIYDDLADADV